MTNLFDPNTNAQILQRIEKLSQGSSALWGKMSVSQMLGHLDLSLQANFGQIQLKKDIIGVFFRGIARKILLGKKPFPKHLPAPRPTLVKGEVNFEKVKQMVMHSVSLYVEKGDKVLSGNPHNILGNITPDESAYISYKHIDHHLRQFGV